MTQADNRSRLIDRHFTGKMEAAALYQLREAFADGKGEAGRIAHAVKAMGREYDALIRRVWAKHFNVAGPV